MKVYINDVDEKIDIISFIFRVKRACQEEVRVIVLFLSNVAANTVLPKYMLHQL